MKRWMISGLVLLAAVALLTVMLSGAALAQETRTRIAYLLAETVYVSGDVTVADDITAAGDVTAASFSTSGSGGVGSFGQMSADTADVADDLTATDIYVDRWLTSLGAPITVITSTRTITPVLEGVYVIASGGAAAELSVGSPGAGHNGMRLTFISLEATAHKVIAPTLGFNAGNAGTDTCTFSTAIGNSIEFILYDGEWYILNSTNCTLG